MRATAENNKGKIEKNQKIKEGECIFPFKYKYETHEKCVDTEKGEICATEINPKTRTLTKYGYCKKTIKKIPKRKVKLTEKPTKLKITPSKTTVKKKKLKITEPTKVSMASPQAKPSSTRLNEEFIKILSELNDIMMRQGEPFRAKAYREAAESIMLYPNDITSPKQLEGVKGIGKTIMSKLNEYVETGYVKI